MKYLNATVVLPEVLIEELQNSTEILSMLRTKVTFDNIHMNHLLRY